MMKNAPLQLMSNKEAVAMKIPAKPITVLLVDDHVVVRAGCRLVLEDTPDIRVVAEASDGETGCACYKKHAPDVVLLDLNMPGIDGLETIRRIKAMNPQARILVFSMHNSETIVRRALDAGATGYLAKQCSTEMVEAVRKVAQGEAFVDAKHATQVTLQKLLASPEDPLCALSAREFQIFRMLAEGHPVSEIAATITISPKTVGSHHTSIMKKLRLQNTTQLTRLAIRCNVIEP